jgi:hypothetical protein
MRTRPRSAAVDGEPAEFTFEHSLLTLRVGGHGEAREHVVTVNLAGQ